MDLDFVASGIFSVLPESQAFYSRFNGADAATVAQDVSPYARQIAFSTGAQIDTAQSVFGGASLLVDNTVGGVYSPAVRTFDMRGDFTIECRLRFTSEATFPMIFEQWDGAVERGIQVYYQPINDTFSFNFSTNGTNLFAQALHTGTFVPVLDTWYAFALVKKGTTWHCYIDGAELSAPISQASVYWRSSSDFIIGGGGDATNFWDGHIEEFRITPAALYTEASYTVALLEFQPGSSAYPFLAHMEGLLNDTNYPSDDPNHFDLARTGTSVIDTAQFKFGTAAFRFDGVNSLTDSVCDGANITETLTPLTHASFDFKRADFGFECFFRLNALPSTNPSEGAGMNLLGKYNRGTSGGMDWFWWLPSDNISVAFDRSLTGAISSQQVSTAPLGLTLATGVWYHIALVRVGNDLHHYFEGVRIGLEVDWFVATPDMWNNDSPSGGHNNVTIGKNGGPTVATRKRAFNGWIDNVNIEKRAIYNGSSYTIPTAPTPTPPDGLSLDPDDLGLLWLADGPSDLFTTDATIRTDDLRGAWILFAGNARIEDAITAGTFGPDNFTVHFDGNGDYIAISRSESMYLDDDDFTIEARVWFQTLPVTQGGMNVISQWLTTGNQRGYHFTIVDNAGPPHSLEFHWSTNGTDDKRVFSAFTPAANQWYHLAVVRSGSSVFLFVDGVELVNDGASDAITTDVIFNPPGRVPIIGHLNETPDFYYFNGNMQNIAWTRSAKWVAGFTPPTDLYVPPALPNI